MNRAPSFQFYPDKWIAGTMHLDAESYRAYHRVLCWMWLHAQDQCSMPDTDGAWQIATCLKNRASERCREIIMQKDMELLEKRGDRLVSRGLQKEARKQKEYRGKQSDNAKTRWHKQVTPMPPHCDGNTTGMPARGVCSPSPSPSPSPTPTPTSEDKNKNSSPGVMAFDVFWKSYPKKIGKGAARKAFEKGKCAAKIEVILKAVEYQSASDQWRKDGGQFIPNPATWLNQERWEDDTAIKLQSRPVVCVDKKQQYERAFQDIIRSLREIKATALNEGDRQRAIESLRDKYRDIPGALKEALEIVG